MEGGELGRVGELEGFEVGEGRWGGGEGGENEESGIFFCKVVQSLGFGGIGEEEEQGGKDEEGGDESGEM